MTPTLADADAWRRGCLGKRLYTARRPAALAAGKWSRPGAWPMGAYRCRWGCAGWHIGHVPVAELARKRAG